MSLKEAQNNIHKELTLIFRCVILEKENALLKTQIMFKNQAAQDDVTKKATYADILTKKQEKNGSSSKLTTTEEKWSTPPTKKKTCNYYTHGKCKRFRRNLQTT